MWSLGRRSVGASVLRVGRSKAKDGTNFTFTAGTGFEWAQLPFLT